MQRMVSLLRICSLPNYSRNFR